MLDIKISRNEVWFFQIIFLFSFKCRVQYKFYLFYSEVVKTLEVDSNNHYQHHHDHCLRWNFLLNMFFFV